MILRLSSLLSLAFMFLALPLSAEAARRAPDTLVVLPARYRTVQLAMDVHEKTGARLLTFQEGLHDGEWVLHQWNGKVWTPVNWEEFSAGALEPSAPAMRDHELRCRSVWTDAYL